MPQPEQGFEQAVYTSAKNLMTARDGSTNGLIVMAARAVTLIAKQPTFSIRPNRRIKVTVIVESEDMTGE